MSYALRRERYDAMQYRRAGRSGLRRGRYGEWGSRKYLLASLDQSLKRLRLDHVDIFYSHRFDPRTPLEETMAALDTARRQGEALYVGLSSYSAALTPTSRLSQRRRMTRPTATTMRLVIGGGRQPREV